MIREGTGGGGVMVSGAAEGSEDRRVCSGIDEEGDRVVVVVEERDGRSAVSATSLLGSCLGPHDEEEDDGGDDRLAERLSRDFESGMLSWV